MAFQITFTQTKEENFNLSYLHKFAFYLALKKPKLLPIIRNLTALLRDLTENLIYYYIDTGSSEIFQINYRSLVNASRISKKNSTKEKKTKGSEIY